MRGSTRPSSHCAHSCLGLVHQPSAQLDDVASSDVGHAVVNDEDLPVITERPRRKARPIEPLHVAALQLIQLFEVGGGQLRTTDGIHHQLHPHPTPTSIHESLPEPPANLFIRVDVGLHADRFLSVSNRQQHGLQ